MNDNGDGGLTRLPAHLFSFNAAFGAGSPLASSLWRSWHHLCWHGALA